MTGFGKGVVQLPKKKITIELKSLNSKNLDINARVPSVYREKELEMRKKIAHSLVRGKVDFGLYIEITGEETTSKVNEGVVKAYMNQLKEIADTSEEELLKMAVKLPDAVKTSKEDIPEEEFSMVMGALGQALSRVNQFREEEGKALETDLNLRINNIEELLRTAKEVDVGRIPQVRERLSKAVADLKEEVDQNRFEQELIYYLEKYDITEETVRLANHLDYFSATLNSKDSNGKKLGFIGQEIGREINTMGAKANDARLQQIVVKMKDELEKIKEQVLNVL